MDLPAIFQPRSGAVPDRRARAHQRAGLEHAQALPGHRRRAGRRHRRLLDRQRPAPREPQRPGRRADRACGCSETFPDQVLSAADEVVLVDLTPEALIQRLREGRVYPAGAGATALNNFFAVGEPGGAARDRAAPGGRGRGGEAAGHAGRGARHPRGGRCRRGAPAGRRAVLALVAPRRARSASCGALGARLSAWRRSSTCSTWPRPGPRRAARSASSSRRCAGSRRCSGRS